MSDKGEEYIIKLYCKDNKSTYEIAKALNTYPNKIRRTLKKHGVELKSKSDAQKLALQNGVANHPTKGKKRTNKEKLSISKSLANHWNNMTEEERKDIASQAKQRWLNMDEEQKEKMRKLASEGIRRAGKEGSKLEKFILERLTKEGYTVDFHNKNLIPNEKLEIDLYIPSLKTIIEIDGPSHFLPIWGEEKLQKQIKADLQKSGRILSMGYAIIRVKVVKKTNLNDKESVTSSIVRILKGIDKKFPPKTKRFIEVEL
tara:strand:- start:503 stop:1276 length:774 start_codon:yes stop_codon:yes gene_type:complete